MLRRRHRFRRRLEACDLGNLPLISLALCLNQSRGGVGCAGGDPRTHIMLARAGAAAGGAVIGRGHDTDTDSDLRACRRTDRLPDRRRLRGRGSDRLLSLFIGRAPGRNQPRQAGRTFGAVGCVLCRGGGVCSCVRVCGASDGDVSERQVRVGRRGRDAHADSHSDSERMQPVRPRKLSRRSSVPLLLRHLGLHAALPAVLRDAVLGADADAATDTSMRGLRRAIVSGRRQQRQLSRASGWRLRVRAGIDTVRHVHGDTDTTASRSMRRRLRRQ
jgi:hypothetical protein